MFAQRFSSLLPKLEQTVYLESLRLHSLTSAKLSYAQLTGIAPFRSPHHQASVQAILGTHDLPGEMSLGHGGVLFLDEFPEFRRDLLEALREPLETKEVRVARAKKKTIWPAKFILLAACNNCPCGWFGSKKRLCRCPTTKLMAYWQRLSGPILDRIDIHLNMAEEEKSIDHFFSQEDLSLNPSAKKGAKLKAKVEETRAFSKDRNRRFNVHLNSELKAQDMQAASGLSSSDFQKFITQIFPSQISVRSLLRALRVARSVADLDFSASMREDDFLVVKNWLASVSAQKRGEHSISGTGSK